MKENPGKGGNLSTLQFYFPTGWALPLLSSDGRSYGLGAEQQPEVLTIQTYRPPNNLSRSPLSCASQSVCPPRTLSANRLARMSPGGRELALVGTQFAPPHSQSRMPIGPPAFGLRAVSPAPYESGVSLALPVAHRLSFLKFPFAPPLGPGEV